MVGFEFWLMATKWETQTNFKNKIKKVGAWAFRLL